MDNHPPVSDKNLTGYQDERINQLEQWRAAMDERTRNIVEKIDDLHTKFSDTNSLISDFIRENIKNFEKFREESDKRYCPKFWEKAMIAVATGFGAMIIYGVGSLIFAPKALSSALYFLAARIS